MRAIVFDFFGTLTDPSAEALRADTFAATAAVWASRRNGSGSPPSAAPPRTTRPSRLR
jgi:hypothetical protein